MRAINHALTGALIGLTISEPLIAVPASFVSHYLCDILPHFGPDPAGGITKRLKSSWFRNSLYADALLCMVLVLALAVWRPEHWLLAAICAFVATLPDFANVGQYIRVNIKHKSYRPGPYVRFAVAIQWFERPIGAVVEVAWFIAALVLITPFLIR